MTENFKIGDQVVINEPEYSEWHEWNGLRAKIVGLQDSDAFLNPIDERPDGYYFDKFYWPMKDIKHA